MIKKVVIMFNGLITLIFGTATLQTGFNGMWMDYNRWTIGVCCVVFGIACIAYSGIFQEAFSKKNKTNTAKG